MFCKNCGKEIDSESKFCSFCGANIQEDISNSNAYNFGKVLGAIGSIAMTNKVVDKMNKDAEDSMKRTLDKARDSLDRISSIHTSGIIDD